MPDQPPTDARFARSFRRPRLLSSATLVLAFLAVGCASVPLPRTAVDLDGEPALGRAKVYSRVEPRSSGPLHRPDADQPLRLAGTLLATINSAPSLGLGDGAGVTAMGSAHSGRFELAAEVGWRDTGKVHYGGGSSTFGRIGGRWHQGTWFGGAGWRMSRQETPGWSKSGQGLFVEAGGGPVALRYYLPDNSPEKVRALSLILDPRFARLRTVLEVSRVQFEQPGLMGGWALSLGIGHTWR